MSQKNSYFSLVIEEDNIKLKVFPPRDGGEMLKIDDVLAYLQKNRIEEFDLKAINSIIYYI